MKSVTHTQSFKIAQSVEEMFPLFTPEGEKLWVPDWDYKNLMGTTELSDNYVFITKTHDHGTTETIWIVKKYDPKTHFVQYYKMEPENKIGVVTIECKELEAELTKVMVTYKYVALSSAGEKFISEFNYTAYENFIDEWQKLLTIYFQSR